MRVVLHIGLHKSGTSTIQNAWWKAFGRGKRVWFPRLGHGPSHAMVAWWVREKSAEMPQHSLADVLASAERRGTELLLLSSEELHQADAAQIDRAHWLLQGHQVSLLITMTSPLSRWPSLWQEMVKHGWAAPQFASIPQVDDPGVMGTGRLEELVDRWGCSDTTICLVRQYPPEPQLVERVSDLMGVPLSAKWRRAWEPVNVSLGDVETRILCEVNRLAPDTRGIESARGRAVVEGLTLHGPAGASRVRLDPDVVDHVVALAQIEQAALLRLSQSGRVRLDDQSELLSRWWEALQDR